jgi:hypothetical protein
MSKPDEDWGLGSVDYIISQPPFKEIQTSLLGGVSVSANTLGYISPKLL